MRSSREAIILLLAAAGAGVDAVVLVAFGVLTAAQTGNTVLLGVALGQAQWDTGLAAAISVAGYVAGVAFGELILERGRRPASAPPRLTAPLGIELLLVLALLVAWRVLGTPGVTAQKALVAVAALAMGVQSAVTVCLRAGPATTYVTGTLTTFTIDLTRSLVGHAFHPEPGVSALPPSSPRPGRYGLTWSAYLAGAVVAAFLGTRVGEAALLLPIGILGVVVIIGFVARAEEVTPAADRPRR